MGGPMEPTSAPSGTAPVYEYNRARGRTLESMKNAPVLAGRGAGSSMCKGELLCDGVEVLRCILRINLTVRIQVCAAGLGII